MGSNGEESEKEQAAPFANKRDPLKFRVENSDSEGRPRTSNYSLTASSSIHPQTNPKRDSGQPENILPQTKPWQAEGSSLRLISLTLLVTALVSMLAVYNHFSNGSLPLAAKMGLVEIPAPYQNEVTLAGTFSFIGNTKYPLQLLNQSLATGSFTHRGRAALLFPQMALQLQAKNKEGAYRTYLELEKFSSLSRFQKYVMLTALDRPDELLAFIKTANSVGSGEHAYSALAYWKKGDYAKAKAEWKESALAGTITEYRWDDDAYFLYNGFQRYITPRSYFTERLGYTGLTEHEIKTRSNKDAYWRNFELGELYLNQKRFGKAIDPLSFCDSYTKYNSNEASNEYSVALGNTQWRSQANDYFSNRWDSSVESINIDDVARAECMERAKFYDQAIFILNKVLKLTDDADAYRVRGGCYLAKGMYKEALQDLNQAIALEPRYGKAFYYRSLVEGKLGKLSDARTDLQKAHEFGLTESPTVNTLGNK